MRRSIKKDVNNNLCKIPSDIINFNLRINSQSHKNRLLSASNIRRVNRYFLSNKITITFE